MPNDFISREVFAEYLRYKIATSMADVANEAAIALIETLVKLRAIPPADVAPVVHARWIETPKDGWTRMECSGCGHSYYVPANINPRERVNGRNYCVKCGSRMDGGEPK
jgi:ribosomal protein L33